MSSILDLFGTARSFVIDLSYCYLYLHDLYSVVSDIDFMFSLLCYYLLCLVRRLVLVAGEGIGELCRQGYEQDENEYSFAKLANLACFLHYCDENRVEYDRF